MSEPKIQILVSLSSYHQSPLAVGLPFPPTTSSQPTLTVTAQALFAKANVQLAQVAVDWSGESLGSPYMCPIIFQSLGGHKRMPTSEKANLWFSGEYNLRHFLTSLQSLSTHHIHSQKHKQRHSGRPSPDPLS